MCFERLQEGEEPACVSECPEEAIIFDKRKELIKEAKMRIYGNPDQYVDHLYGEEEVGGTGYLYMSSKPFEQIGFRSDLGTISYPEYTKTFLYSVPVVLTLWPAFLLALNKATKSEESDRTGEVNHD
jgi:hypothetical protein